RHTRFSRDWSSDVCSSDLGAWYSRFTRSGSWAKTLVELQRIAADIAAENCRSMRTATSGMDNRGRGWPPAQAQAGYSPTIQAIAQQEPMESLHRVTPPEPFECRVERVIHDATIAMARGQGVVEVRVVALATERREHAFVRQHPIVQPFFACIPAEIAFPNVQVDPEGLLRGVIDEMFVILPGTVRIAGHLRVLLVDECPRVAEDATVQVIAEPGHGEGGRCSRTATHRCTPFGISGEFQIGIVSGYVRICQDGGEDFRFDETDISVG